MDSIAVTLSWLWVPSAIIFVKLMTVLDFSLNDLFCIRVGKDAMEISYLIGIATRGFNTEYQLKEVCTTKHTEGVGGSEAKAVPPLALHVLLARENAALISR